MGFKEYYNRNKLPLRLIGYPLIVVLVCVALANIFPSSSFIESLSWALILFVAVPGPVIVLIGIVWLVIGFFRK